MSMDAIKMGDNGDILGSFWDIDNQKICWCLKMGISLISGHFKRKNDEKLVDFGGPAFSDKPK
jgi:hypothetical protein